MQAKSVHQTFTAALESLIEQVKQDRAILAAVLCGSLSHDVVWARSDIDLLLVTIDDRKTELSDIALNADGVNVHALLMPRTEFRRTVEGSVNNSFFHSFLAKGRLLYTHDPTIADLCAGLHTIGERDSQLQLLRAGTGALPPIDKAHKWFVTRGDLEYAALWILFAATSLARIEVIGRRMLADREVLLQALALNPAFFDTIYTKLLNARKTKRDVQAALDAIDAYVAARAADVFALVLDYLREAADVRSSTEIEAHFKRHYDIGGVVTACEYLAHRGLIGKAATSARLTRRSTVDVQELAFFFSGRHG
jgi:polymorphic toxin system nucleotidyltransferase-like protein